MIRQKRQYIKGETKSQGAQRRRLQDPQTNWIVTLRNRAQHKGLPFNITREDLVIPDVCPILKIPLIRGIGKATPNSPSVDRIDNTKGYLKGNVRIISFKANRAKGDMSLEDAERLVAYMKGEL